MGRKRRTARTPGRSSPARGRFSIQNPRASRLQAVLRILLRTLCPIPWYLGARRMNSGDWPRVWRTRPVPACYTPGALEWRYFYGWVKAIPALTRWWLWSAPRRDIVRQMAELTSWNALLHVAAMAMYFANQPAGCLAILAIVFLVIVASGAFSLWATMFQGQFIRGDFGRMYYPVPTRNRTPPPLRTPDDFREDDMTWWRSKNSQAWCYIGLWSSLWLPVSLTLLFWSTQELFGYYGFQDGEGARHGLSVWFQFVLDNVIRTPLDLSEIYGWEIAQVRSLFWEGDHIVFFTRLLVSLLLVQAGVAIVRRRLMLIRTVKELDLYPAHMDPPAQVVRLGHWLFAPMAGRVMEQPDAEERDPGRLEKLRQRRLQALKVLERLVDDRLPGIAVELAAGDPDQQVAAAALAYLLEDNDEAILEGLVRRSEDLSRTGHLAELKSSVEAGPGMRPALRRLSKRLENGGGKTQ